jgi:sec-independent protein translocase protein TatA
MILLAFGFGNLGGPDLFLILLIVLILFGAKKLPDLARSLGQSMNEFRKAREDFDRELRESGVQRLQAQPPAPAQQDAPASGVQEATLGPQPQSGRIGK